MPLIPSASITTNTTPLADTQIPFNITLTTADVSEDFVTIPVGKKGMKISLINEGPGSAWIRPNGNASVASPSLEVKANEQYYDDNIGILNRWAFIGDAGLKPHIRGLAWAGVA